MTQILGPASGPVGGLHDRPSWSYLDTCHAAREERNETVAVAAAEDAGPLTQHLDDLIDQRRLVVVAGILICQVRVVATEEPHAQHDSCHSGKLARPSLAALAHRTCAA